MQRALWTEVQRSAEAAVCFSLCLIDRIIFLFLFLPLHVSFHAGPTSLMNGINE